MVFGAERRNSATDSVDTRFDQLVALRQTCSELARHHLSVLDAFRSPADPGRSLTQLISRAVSPPGILRLLPAERTSQSAERPFKLGVTSTCAALRSILRHPAVDYRNLRPLHLLLELLDRFDAVVKEGQAVYDNTVAFGQTAELADAIIEALEEIATPMETAKLEVLATEIVLSPEAAYQRGALQCYDQVLRDIETLAQRGRPGSQEAADAVDQLRFSLLRLCRVCNLAKGEKSRTDEEALKEWSDTVRDVDSKLRAVQRMTPLQLKALVRLTGQGSDVVRDPAEWPELEERSFEDVRRFARLIAGRTAMAGIGGSRVQVDGERVEAVRVARALLDLCRRELGHLVADWLELTDLRARSNTFPHPYLIYWALEGLGKENPRPEAVTRLLDAARHEYFHILASAAVAGNRVDAFRLGYHVALEIEFNPTGWDRSLARLAINYIVAAQHPDGSFEKLDRLWVTPTGDAYALSIELLTTLLFGFDEHAEFLDLLEPCLERALVWLKKYRQPAGGDPDQWVWGESGGAAVRPPQAWITGEAYSFLYLAKRHYGRALANLAIRKFNGRLSGRPTLMKDYSKSSLAEMTPDFWGADGTPKVTDEMRDNVLRPLQARHRYFGEYALAARADRSDMSRSGILYGPPGTGKTTLVEELAKFLGWPLIILGPFDFLRLGNDGVAEAAGEVFRWLYVLEDCVILFDEMEEFIRARVTRSGSDAVKLGRYWGTQRTRTSSDSESPENASESGRSNTESAQSRDDRRDSVSQEPPYVQRIWTTLFLPMLQRLHDDASTIFFVATNYYEKVDPAIARPGRFDFRIHMLPPSPERKIREVLIPELKDRLRLSEAEKEGLTARLHDRLVARGWLVERPDGSKQLLRDEGASEDELRFVSSVVQLPNGQRGEGPIAVDLRFRYFTRADTLSLADMVVDRFEPDAPELSRLDRIASDVLDCVMEMIPSAFDYDPGEDYLQWSRLRRARRVR